MTTENNSDWVLPWTETMYRAALASVMSIHTFIRGRRRMMIDGAVEAGKKTSIHVTWQQSAQQHAEHYVGFQSKFHSDPKVRALSS